MNKKYRILLLTVAGLEFFAAGTAFGRKETGAVVVFTTIGILILVKAYLESKKEKV